MAPREDPDRSTSGSSSDNPFIAFRHFVDDELSSLFSAFGSLRPHFQKSFEELEKEHQQAWERFTKNYERATNPERTRIQARSGEGDDNNSAPGVGGGNWPRFSLDHMEVRRAPQTSREEEEMTCPYLPAPSDRKHGSLLPSASSQQQRHDEDADDDTTCPYLPAPSQRKHESLLGSGSKQHKKDVPIPAMHHPMTRFLGAMGEDDEMDTITFPISSAFDRFPSPFQNFRYLAWEPDFIHGLHKPTANFCAFSPYSPRQLERDPVSACFGGLWREAFRDLLVAQQTGGAMPPSSIRGCLDGTPKEWTEELQDCGLASRIVDVRDVFDEDEDQEEVEDEGLTCPYLPAPEERGDGPDNELELYNQWLQREKGGASSSPTARQQRPSVISTLTTTERRQLPDGTVTTKTVLKKRFADGTEENTEQTDTSHVDAASVASSRAMRSEQQQQPRVRQALKDEKATDKGWDLSWLWSRG